MRARTRLAHICAVVTLVIGCASEQDDRLIPGPDTKSDYEPTEGCPSNVSISGQGFTELADANGIAVVISGVTVESRAWNRFTIGADGRFETCFDDPELGSDEPVILGFWIDADRDGRCVQVRGENSNLQTTAAEGKLVVVVDREQLSPDVTYLCARLDGLGAL
jgi:hypothetical protein